MHFCCLPCFANPKCMCHGHSKRPQTHVFVRHVVARDAVADPVTNPVTYPVADPVADACRRTARDAGNTAGNPDHDTCASPGHAVHSGCRPCGSSGTRTGPTDRGPGSAQGRRGKPSASRASRAGPNAFRDAGH